MTTVMLSSTIHTPRFLSPPPPTLLPHRIQCNIKRVSPALIPAKPPPQQRLYQPFRPPPSPIPPQFRSLDVNGRLEILTNRLGLWFEYAPLIPSLTQEGFPASKIEEITGISGIEQNRFIVATQVRDSLVESELDPDILSFYDLGGAQLLYEIRLLSTSQRAEAARLIAEEKFEVKQAQELARAIKDFPRTKKEKGWESFDYSIPRDCLAFMYYRVALEHHRSMEQRDLGLKKALEMAGSDKAKNKILEALNNNSIAM